MQEWLSVDDLARLVDVPKRTVYEWNRTHTGPPVTRVGKYVRYQRLAVEAWLDANTKASA